MKGRLTVLDPVVFGHFELRPAQRQLLNSGEPVALGARAFDVLTALVQNRERVVTKEELLRQVWQGVVVEENNLTVHVSRLRKLLGADASHAWVSLWCGPDVGWVDFDPTNNQLPDTRYVTVAIGRDYADVPPMRGVVHGGGEHTLKVAVTVF